ncbi:MAG: FAD-binding oxidoreductase [Deltaproteobacteria bacterium]|nr:FAD-binding oxidoreductase [Deltaproteobacteria bacterium]
MRTSCRKEGNTAAPRIRPVRHGGLAEPRLPGNAVVIGAGITGSLVAHALAARGWSVTVLEAQHVGAGSSSRTAAGIRQQFSTPLTVAGMRYSVEFYANFRERVGGEERPIVQQGYLFLLAMQEHVDEAYARVRMQQGLGVGAEVLDHEGLAERFPWVERSAVLGATFCPTDGFLHPATVYNEAMAAAQRLGARLVQHAPVTGCERVGQRIVSVSTPRGSFAADLFIDATNAWSPRLARVLGATELPIAPLKRYLWFIQRDGPLSADELAAMPLVVTPSGAYCRPESRESLLVGWAHDARPEPDFDYDDQDRVEEAFSHRSGTDSLAFAAWASVAEVIPRVGEFAGITATTCGYYATTPDHNPFLAYDPQVSNLVRLAGFSGHGAMFGPFTALVAATLADTGRDVSHVSVGFTDVPMCDFAIGREYRHAERLVI